MKMTTRYNVHDAIATFFDAATDVTREECDRFTRDRHGCEPKAVPLQGMCSYTVAAGANDGHILQFRDENSPLDVKLLMEAKAAHPNVVSSIQHLGQLGSSRGLHVYEMERLAGETYILAVDNSLPQPDDSKLRQMTTISDLAMYVERMNLRHFFLILLTPPVSGSLLSLGITHRNLRLK